MGGIVSNPLDDAKRQEIQDTVEEVMGVFSKEFAMGYKTALIDKIRAEKEEKHAKGGYEYQLVDPPKDATVIKAGYITKRGDVKLAQLSKLDLHQTSLSGTLPTEVADLAKLRHLDPL